MSDNRRQILDMLAEKKITADEAEAPPERGGKRCSRAAGEKIKYLRVLVDTKDPLDGPPRSMCGYRCSFCARVCG